MLSITAGGHSAYQDIFVADFLKFYPDPFSLSKDTWKIITQFWHLDLTLTDSLLAHHYARKGPLPRVPSCMMRECPLYAILSGFTFGGFTFGGFTFGYTPGIGTFYDFFSRLWQSNSDNLSTHERYKSSKVKRGKKKGDKTPIQSQSISSRMIPFLDRIP